jgi:FkbM family methyltransferase
MAFEPDPRTFAVLKRNVEKNGLRSVELHNVALGARDGQADFYYRDDRPGWVAASTLRGFPSNATGKVEVRRLSPMITQEVDLLKLDIEGAEEEVLDDLVAAGKLRSIRQMVLEYHHHRDPEQDTLGCFLRALEKHDFGYAIASGLLTPFEPRISQSLVLYAYRKGNSTVVN